MNVYLAGTYGPGGSEAWLGGVPFDAGERDGHPRPARQSRGADGKLISRVNLLESFYYLSNWQVNHLGEFKRFMLDSGAYTLAISRKGALDDVELRDYVSRYAEFVATHDVTHYFEMDIDHVKGTDWVRRTTDMLEQETGKTPVPVWHPCRKAKGFEEMCERYPYVAIGTTDIRRQLAKSVRWFTDTAHRALRALHGRGGEHRHGHLHHRGVLGCAPRARARRDLRIRRRAKIALGDLRLRARHAPRDRSGEGDAG